MWKPVVLYYHVKHRRKIDQSQTIESSVVVNNKLSGTRYKDTFLLASKPPMTTLRIVFVFRQGVSTNECSVVEFPFDGDWSISVEK